jgi:mannose-6-phosphate isomerase-like protein (cupin superfamily)
MITLVRENIEKWANIRKMSPESLLNKFNAQGEKVSLSYDDLEQLSKLLNVSPADLLRENTTLDLDRGVKVSRNGETFKRVSERNGKKYYTYNHLVTTNAYPTLMPLRVELHCTDEDDVVLNGGHSSTEIVYVTKGTVRMHWDYDNHINQLDLHVGDSAFIQPGVSHSFMAAGKEDAELIAINW